MKIRPKFFKLSWPLLGLAGNRSCYDPSAKVHWQSALLDSLAGLLANDSPEDCQSIPPPAIAAQALCLIACCLFKIWLICIPVNPFFMRPSYHGHTLQEIGQGLGAMVRGN